MYLDLKASLPVKIVSFVALAAFTVAANAFAQSVTYEVEQFQNLYGHLNGQPQELIISTLDDGFYGELHIEHIADFTGDGLEDAYITLTQEGETCGVVLGCLSQAFLIIPETSGHFNIAELTGFYGAYGFKFEEYQGRTAIVQENENSGIIRRKFVFLNDNFVEVEVTPHPIVLKAQTFGKK